MNKSGKIHCETKCGTDSLFVTLIREKLGTELNRRKWNDKLCALCVKNWTIGLILNLTNELRWLRRRRRRRRRRLPRWLNTQHIKHPILVREKKTHQIFYLHPANRIEPKSSNNKWIRLRLLQLRARTNHFYLFLFLLLFSRLPLVYETVIGIAMIPIVCFFRRRIVVAAAVVQRLSKRYGLKFAVID